MTESSANGKLPCFRRMQANSHSCSRTTTAVARTTCQPRSLLWTNMFRAHLPAGYCCPSPCDSPSQPHMCAMEGPLRALPLSSTRKRHVTHAATGGHRGGSGRTSRNKHFTNQNTLFIFLINTTMFNGPW